MMTDPQQPAMPSLPDDVAVTHDHLLDKQVQITQPKTGYRVGSDAVLAAASLTARRGRVLDLGAGVGGISLCIAHRLESLQITAVEIDPTAAALSRYNAAVNGLHQSKSFLPPASAPDQPSADLERHQCPLPAPKYWHQTPRRERPHRAATPAQKTGAQDWLYVITLPLH